MPLLHNDSTPSTPRSLDSELIDLLARLEFGRVELDKIASRSQQGLALVTITTMIDLFASTAERHSVKLSDDLLSESAETLNEVQQFQIAAAKSGIFQLFSSRSTEDRKTKFQRLAEKALGVLERYANEIEPEFKTLPEGQSWSNTFADFINELRQTLTRFAQ